MVTPPDFPSPNGLHLPPGKIAELFPFFFTTNTSGLLDNVGPSLAKILPSPLVGTPLSSVFRQASGVGSLEIQDLRASASTLFLIEAVAVSILFRGQFVALENGGVAFLGSPWFSDTAQLAQRQLSVSDFAIHDPAVDLLHVLRAQSMATNDQRRLTEKLTAQRTKLEAANRLLVENQRESRTLALIAERTDNAVVLTDASGRVEWVNSGFFRLTGYTLAEVQGRRPGDMLQGPGTDPAQIAYMKACLARMEGFKTEILNYAKNGNRYWVAIEVQPIRDAEGHIRNFMALESDITARRIAEANLRLQFRTAQLLAPALSFDEVAPALLRVIGEHQHWSLVNLWCFDEPSESLKLKTCWTLDAPRREQFQPSHLTATLKVNECLPGMVWKSQQSLWVDSHNRFPDCPRSRHAIACGFRAAAAFPVVVEGQTVAVVEMWAARPEPTDHDQLRTLDALSVQIGQFVERAASREAQQRHSRELSELNTELAKANRAKNEFLASISHEIRTPLNGVIGSSDTLDDTPLNADQRESLENIKTSAKHLHSLLNDVLDFSRIDAGSVELNWEPTSIKDLTDDIVRIFRPVSIRSNLEFKVDCTIAPDLFVLVDAGRLRQILINLLSNAFKFTTRGSVTFRVHHRRDGDRVDLRFEIEDTGIGIQPDKADLLFKPFNQLDSSNTRRFGGAGLGLAISRRLAEMMRGRLEFDPDVTIGSRFRLELTVAVTAEPTAPNSSRSQLALTKEVLVVDDHPANATLLRMLLKRLGLTAHHCESGEDALEYCRVHHPEVVLMDLHMPGMDGIEATQHIRAESSPDQPPIKIIALTADVRTDTKQACLDAGMDDFLSKPLRLKDLHRVLERHQTTVAAPTKPPEPEMDWDLIAMLLEHDDDEESKNGLAYLFADMWADMVPNLQNIDKARQANQAASGQKLCHRMRGIVANYGFTGAARLLEAMEYDSAAFNDPDSSTRVQNALDRGRAALFTRYPFLNRPIEPLS